MLGENGRIKLWNCRTPGHISVTYKTCISYHMVMSQNYSLYLTI
nr:hypothetical protein CDS [Sweet potato collusive virus]